MRILIITQNEPFFLAENLRYLIKILPKHSQIIGAVVTSPSPFGKKESFLDKARRTYNVFGIKFFLFYSFKYLKNIFDQNSKVKNVFKQNKIVEVNLNKHINHPESISIIKEFEPDLLVSILYRITTFLEFKRIIFKFNRNCKRKFINYSKRI